MSTEQGDALDYYPETEDYNLPPELACVGRDYIPNQDWLDDGEPTGIGLDVRRAVAEAAVGVFNAIGIHCRLDGVEKTVRYWSCLNLNLSLVVPNTDACVALARRILNRDWTLRGVGFNAESWAESRNIPLPKYLSEKRMPPAVRRGDGTRREDDARVWAAALTVKELTRLAHYVDRASQATLVPEEQRAEMIEDAKNMRAERAEYYLAPDLDPHLVYELATCDLGGPFDEVKAQGTRFLVPGAIPLGSVTLLLGDRRAGKSTLGTELAIAAAAEGRCWCGLPVWRPEKDGSCIVLSGEDDRASIRSRRKLLDPDAKASGLVLRSMDSRPLRDILGIYKGVSVRLLVIDPLRKYLQGDEDSSAAVSEFFSLLEDFAAEHDCAVVVIHHPRKGARAGSLDELARNVRGSSVILDRPRAVLGLVRRGSETILGIPAPEGAPLHNFVPPAQGGDAGEPWAPIGEIRLQFDPATLRHLPVAPVAASATGRKAARTADADGIDARALAAIGEIVARGERVSRSGKSSLFGRGHPGLAGLSRVRVAEAIDRLVASGAVVADRDKGLLPSQGAGADGPVSKLDNLFS